MDRIRNREATKKGYTLVEVLISMFVFGVGVMAVLAFLSGSVKYMTKLNRLSAADQFSRVLINFLQEQDIGSAYLSAGSHEINDNLVSTIIPSDDVRNRLMKLLPGLTSGSAYVVSDYIHKGKLIKFGKVNLQWKGGHYVSYFIKE